jgi:NADH dehydrogenase FAD-containing subunit
MLKVWPARPSSTRAGARVDGGGDPLPGLVPVAQQQREYVGELIARRLCSEPAPPSFRYRNKGMGDIAIDGHGRVKRPDGSAISGLYVAGGSTGGLERAAAHWAMSAG